MKYPKRSQYKYAKSRYRIRNWPEYEAGLRLRGDLTITEWGDPPIGGPGICPQLRAMHQRPHLLPYPVQTNEDWPTFSRVCFLGLCSVPPHRTPRPE